MTALLDRLRPGPGAVAGRWAVGVGDTLAAVLRPPEPIADVVRLLNHFGGVAISAQAVEYDGDDVKWADVDEIRTRNLLGYLFSGALDKQVDRLPLPWFPFRGTAISVASQVVLAAVVAAAGPLLGPVRDIDIPSDVRHRGMLKHRTLSPGVFGAILLADPAVQRSLLATAAQHGVPVRPAGDDAMADAERRAEQLKSLLLKLFQLIERVRSDGDEVVGVDGGSAHLDR